MLVVVGGHSPNIGKTAVVSGLIRKFRARNWTALKVTQYGNGICTSKGEPCGCEPGDAADHPFTLSEEYEPTNTDSGRFLAAGADRSFWLRVPSGRISSAADTLRKVRAQSENVIVESNSVLEVLQPDVFLMLLDFGCPDFQPSSLHYLDRADAFVVIDRGINAPMWEDISRGIWSAKPHFLVKPPRYVTPEVAGFLERHWTA